MDWRDAWKGWATAFGERPGRFFEAGEVRLALLSLLDDAPHHGYELMKALEERSGGLYRASAGAIYPTLQQLEDEEKVAASAENGKKVYRLTAGGRAELESERERVDRIWARAKRWHEVGSWTTGVETGLIAMLAGELVGEAMRAVKRVGRDAAGQERVRSILEEARHALRELGDEGPSGAPDRPPRRRRDRSS
jgi:DNA-binding PadR family transcriptional regulator